MESNWQTSFSLCDSSDSMESSWQTSYLIGDFNNLLGDSNDSTKSSWQTSFLLSDFNDSMKLSGFGLSIAFLRILRVYNSFGS